jgi:hypothetical protein
VCSSDLSALAALDIWVQSLIDFDFAAGTYLTLSSLAFTTPFQEALAWSGFSDPFAPESLSALSGNLISVLLRGEAPSGVMLERPRNWASGGESRHTQKPSSPEMVPLLPDEMMLPAMLAVIVLAGGVLVHLIKRR